MPYESITRAAPLEFDRLRPKHEQMLPLVFIKRDLFSIAEQLDLDIVTGFDDLDYFFQVWGQTTESFLFLFARYRAWYMNMEDRSTWVSRPADANVTLYARQAGDQRHGVLVAVVSSLGLRRDDVVFMDDDEQVIPCPPEFDMIFRD